MSSVIEGLSPWFVNKRLDSRDMRAGLAAAFAGGGSTPSPATSPAREEYSPGVGVPTVSSASSRSNSPAWACGSLPGSA